MDIDFCVKNYLQNYNLLVEQLTFLFNEQEYKEYIVFLNSEPKDKKWLRGVRFQQQISDELFDTFLESKIKLFSHKDENTKNVSESLFGAELSLKKIFNNRDDNSKFILWAYLHLMVLMVELAQKKQNKERVKKLSKLIEENAPLLEKAKTKAVQQNNVKDPKSMIKEMFNVEVNEQTNEMLNDIVKSFESSLKGEGANPLAGILDISQKISSKYQDKINTGEIELNKLMEGIQKNIPGMDEIMKGGLGGMMGGMMGGGEAAKPKETVIIDENFSTANVELGKQNETKGGFNIGKMLSLANSFGVLGGDGKGGDGKSGNNPLDANMSELFGMISSMGSSNNKEDIENLKTKMDEFLAKQGIDINKLNAEIDTMMQQNKDKLEEVNQKLQLEDKPTDDNSK
jgi:predicted amino acid-binding ACT domain protein